MTSRTPDAAAETNPTPVVVPGDPTMVATVAEPSPFPRPRDPNTPPGPRATRRQARERGGVFRRDIRRDDVRPGVALGVAAAPVAGWLALLALFAGHKPWLYLVLREDYPVEWAQFSLCLVASLLALVAAAGFARRGQRLTALLLLLAGLGLLGLAGEEISWGQRVFGLAEPAELARVNHQDELNVHDTFVAGVAVDEVFEVFSWLLGVAGVGLALLTRGRRPKLGGRLWWNLSPPLFTLPGFLAIVLYRPLVMVMPASIAAPVTVFQEWVEFCLYLAIAATVVCTYRRVRRSNLADGEPPRWVLAPGSGPARLPAVLALLVAALTVTFAVMTIRHGMTPGNVTEIPTS